MRFGLQAALSTLVGTAGSYVYLRWLMHDMDELSEDMVVPFRNAKMQPAGFVQTAALGFAAYRSVPRRADCCTSHHCRMRQISPLCTIRVNSCCTDSQASLEAQAAGSSDACSSSGSLQQCLRSACGTSGGSLLAGRIPFIQGEQIIILGRTTACVREEHVVKDRRAAIC